MTENSTLAYFIEDKPSANGKQDLKQVKDNRLQLTVNGRFVETWELMVMQELKVNDWLMVFTRYLYRGDRLISSDLPAKPLDELTRAEIAQIQNSDAYKVLRRFTVTQLRQAAESFARQIGEAGTDPN